MLFKNYTNFNSEAYLYSIEGKGPTLPASGANSRIKIWINNRVRTFCISVRKDFKEKLILVFLNLKI